LIDAAGKRLVAPKPLEGGLVAPKPSGEGGRGKKNANGRRLNFLSVLMTARYKETVERCSKETEWRRRLRSAGRCLYEPVTADVRLAGCVFSSIHSRRRRTSAVPGCRPSVVPTFLTAVALAKAVRLAVSRRIPLKCHNLRPAEKYFDQDVDPALGQRLSGVRQVIDILLEEAVMKYLCLIYDDEKTMAGMSKAEGDAFMGEYFAFTEGIKKSGHYVGGEALKPVHTATTVRVRNGKMSTTDGPFAETKEQLGGYYMIEAKDLNEALQVAAKIPSAKTGSVEVRPIEVFG
jgi:hypothetical protein